MKEHSGLRERAAREAMKQALPAGWVDVGIGLPEKGDWYLAYQYLTSSWAPCESRINFVNNPQRVIRRVI